MNINFNSEEFFNEIYWPLFFDCDDKSQQLLSVTNSSFFANLSVDCDLSIKSRQNYELERFWNDICLYNKGEKLISGGMAVGYNASSIDGTTSGQVAVQHQNPKTDEILYSWFGSGLAVGFGGGIDILIDNEEIIWFIYEGWKYYRKYINETPNLKGRQIAGWNGYWLCYGWKYKNDLENAYNQVISNIKTEKNNKGALELNRPEWHEQIFELSKTMGETKLPMFAYNYGQTNENYGFSYIDLPKVKKLYQLYEYCFYKLNGKNPTSEQAFEKVFESYYKFRDVLSLGVGVGRTSQMKPKYILAKIKDDIDKIIVNVTWNLAMLEKDDYIKNSKRMVELLLEFKENSKNTTKKDIDDVFDSSNKTQLLSAIRNLVETSIKNKMEIDVNKYEEIVLTINDIPFEKIKYFIELTRNIYTIKIINN